MSNIPLVSIACITYNHEKYIKDAIEGFLSQRTDFDYEIIIHDDASTDRTADIIRQYEAEYPDKIHGIYQKENQYSKRKPCGMIRTYIYPVCRGKYIALCEGDDFWIDRNKLQLQIDYMESHPECAVTCHEAVYVDYGNEDVTVYSRHPYHEERYLSEEEVIIQYHGDFPTASAIYRMDAFCTEDFFMGGVAGDYAHELYAITKGKIYFFPRIMSVYRFMHEGSWSRRYMDDMMYRLVLRGKAINFFRQYDIYTNHKYQQAIIYKESEYIIDNSHSINQYGHVENGKIGEFINGINERTDNQYKQYFKKVEEVYRQMFDEDYCPASIKAFVEYYDHIYIWGAGKYGQRVARQLINMNSNFEAFLVSESSGEEAMGKSVIGINEITYPMERVGIIVAVNVRNWGELWKRFVENKELHYIYPYGVTEII